MKLWTWHKPDFSLASGRVDQFQSSYYRSMPSIPLAYAELARRLGTDQIVWCYTRPDDYKQLPGDTRIQWAFEIPDYDVLAMIDTWVWEKIIGSEACPPDLVEKWKSEAARDCCEYESHLKMRTQEYLSQPAANGDWWSTLFVRNATGGDITVLVKHPIADGLILKPPDSTHTRM